MNRQQAKMLVSAQRVPQHRNASYGGSQNYMLQVEEILDKKEKEGKKLKGILELCEIELRRETKALKISKSVERVMRQAGRGRAWRRIQDSPCQPEG